MWSFDFHDHKGAVSRLSSSLCQYLVPIMRSYLLWNLQLNLTLSEKLLVNDKIPRIIVNAKNHKNESSSSLSICAFYCICFVIYLSGFVKTWLKKFQVLFNYLTSKWNGKQLKVTS